MKNYKFDLLAIIVSYNPEDIIKLNRIIEILSIDSDVILIDNSDQNEFIESLSNTINSAKYFIQVKENKGIAYAQNLGIKKALELNYKFILLFDDDSLPTRNFIAKILHFYAELATNSNLKIGSISARPIIITDTKTIDLSNAKINLNHKFTKYNLMNSSGTMIPTDVIRDVGSMDEDLFIDLVDFDWCWRSSQRNYKHFLCRDLCFIHSLGDNTKNIFGVNISKGNPIRNFYGFRNLIVLLRRSYVPFSWKISSLIKIPIKIIYQILFFDNKLLRLKFIYKGLKSGVFNELGKLKL
jgi:rhamnosyltransferase